MQPQKSQRKTREHPTLWTNQPTSEQNYETTKLNMDKTALAKHSIQTTSKNSTAALPNHRLSTQTTTNKEQNRATTNNHSRTELQPTIIAEQSCYQCWPSHQKSEATALLTWKASLHNQSQTLLSSWVGSNHYSWFGIGCNKAGRVLFLILISHSFLISSPLNFLTTHFMGPSPPPNIGSLWTLTYLILSLNNLSRTILTEIGQLTNLRILYLNRNPIGGSIPQQIGLVSSLNELILYTKNLTGSIPSLIGNLNNLTIMYLYDNRLSGSIPQEIGMLKSLVDLELSRNNLTGSIPTSIGNLGNLTTLYLYDK
ncbi:hypothetical protein ACSBR1_021031 [Camellia fascicularis]